MVSFSFCFGQNKMKTSGILPDENAKVGTWTEYQTVKDSNSMDIYKYRVRLKSGKKWSGDVSECIFEVEVVNLTKNTLGVGIDYSYRQSMLGRTSYESGQRTGVLTKGKKWNFELMAFHDKEKQQKYHQPCFKCKMEYEIISVLKDY
jgi:hypothetical protein